MRMLLTAGFLLTATFTVLPRAQSPAPVELPALGPQVGQQVPDFSLADQTGAVRTLKSILGPNGALLVFYRSSDW